MGAAQALVLVAASLMLAPSDEALGEGGEAVAELLAPDHARVGHPIQLDRAARADEGTMPVPGVGSAAKGDERAPRRRNFDDGVVETVGRAQEPPLPLGAGRRPVR